MLVTPLFSWFDTWIFFVLLLVIARSGTWKWSVVGFISIKLGHSRPPCWEIFFFSHACAKTALVEQLFRIAQERKRKCVSVAKSTPNHRIGAFPTTMSRNIFFTCVRKIALVEQLFEIALERKWKRVGVAKYVSNHWIGAFPTTMPRNILFACVRKNRSSGEAFHNHPRTQDKMHRCSEIGSQPSNWAFPTTMSRNIFFAYVRKNRSLGAALRNHSNENARVSQNRFPTIELGHSLPQYRKIFFSLRAKKPLPRRRFSKPP